MVAFKFSIKHVVSILAIAIPTTQALGCYRNGVTWSQWNIITGNHGFDSIASEICSAVWTGYGSYAGKIKCLSGGSRYHVDVTVINLRGYWVDLNYVECKNSVLTEMNGCSHGSEQNHGDFWYKLDPQDGPC